MHSLPNELVRRERARRSYYHFVKEFWEVLEPATPLDDNWHVKLLCDEFQKDIERIGRREPKTQDTYVNIPPRCMKSYIFSIMPAAWTWIHYPALKFIVASHTDTLANELSVKARQIIQSPKYQAWYGDIYQLHSAQNEKARFFNNQGGERIATSTGAGITGSGADCLVGETLIRTNKGVRRIDEIIPEDRVLSYDLSSNSVEWGNVVATREKKSSNIYELETANGLRIQATGDHRIYTKGGYKPVSSLFTGDILVTPEGEDSVNIVRKLEEETILVYDIQVEGNHNFFANGILVHNCIVVDDYIKPQDAGSIVKIQTANDWFNVTLYSRLNQQSIGSRWLIMQRLHEDDIVSQLKKSYRGIVLPMVYDERIVILPKGISIPNYNQDGDLFWETRFPPSEIEAAKKRLGFSYAAQFQQTPNPLDGTVFGREDFQYYKELPPIDDIILSADTAVKTGQYNDYSVIVVLGYGRNGGYYVIDLFRAKVAYSELKRNIFLLEQRYSPSTVIIEDRSSGHQLIQELRKEGLPIPRESKKVSEGGGFKGNPDKLYRVSTVSGSYKAGQVYLPEDKEWTLDIVEEHLAFSPAGTHKHDDIVDSMSQGIFYLKANSASQWIAHYNSLADEANLNNSKN